MLITSKWIENSHSYQESRCLESKFYSKKVIVTSVHTTNFVSYKPNHYFLCVKLESWANWAMGHLWAGHISGPDVMYFEKMTD